MQCVVSIQLELLVQTSVGPPANGDGSTSYKALSGFIWNGSPVETFPVLGQTPPAPVSHAEF
jgi:hypothetical protein